MSASPIVLAYVIGEVARQGHNVEQPEGASRVLWMLEAWEWAKARPASVKILPKNIAYVGHLIEPEKNPWSNDSPWSFRRCGVRVGSRVCSDWREVPKMVKVLCEHWNDGGMEPETFYKWLLEIHPFIDGNGRTGKVMLNWLNGSMDTPVMPPNFWGCANA